MTQGPLPFDHRPDPVLGAALRRALEPEGEAAFLARLLARGFFASAPSGELRDCLARMGLEHPSGAVERVEAALLRAALE